MPPERILPLRPAPNAEPEPAAGLTVTLDLRPIVAAIVAQVVAQLGQTATPTADAAEEPVWLSRAEAAKRLGVCVNSIDNLRSRGRLQALMVGRSPRFLREDVDRLAGGSSH